jgi:hypothetical protein
MDREEFIKRARAADCTESEIKTFLAAMPRGPKDALEMLIKDLEASVRDNDPPPLPSHPLDFECEMPVTPESALEYLKKVYPGVPFTGKYNESVNYFQFERTEHDEEGYTSLYRVKKGTGEASEVYPIEGDYDEDDFPYEVTKRKSMKT